MRVKMQFYHQHPAHCGLACALQPATAGMLPPSDSDEEDDSEEESSDDEPEAVAPKKALRPAVVSEKPCVPLSPSARRVAGLRKLDAAVTGSGSLRPVRDPAVQHYVKSQSSQILPVRRRLPYGDGVTSPARGC